MMDSIEKNLILQGASAVEDQLQEGVPQALGAFAEAGVKVWMITGDKVGTARNIAVSCNLLKDESQMELVGADKIC
jgi:phospholipid-translocating ATPase